MTPEEISELKVGDQIIRVKKCSTARGISVGSIITMTENQEYPKTAAIRDFEYINEKGDIFTVTVGKVFCDDYEIYAPEDDIFIKKLYK